ncbi:MAG: alpha/beta hydrolase [Gemmataceae bacterium]
MFSNRTGRNSILALALLGLLGCRVTSLPLWNPAAPVDDQDFEVKELRDVAYVPEASSFRQTLDLFLPRSDEPFPVVILVHGGAWLIGDNRCCGLYPSVAKYLASRGIGVVVPNYRQSPWVRHPEHVKDLARVVAWTRANIARHGGTPERLFLAGHSAGGHLVSLLATDESYLRDEGLRADLLAGVITISGVYEIPSGNLQVTLGGAGDEGFRIDELMPIRDGPEPLVSGVLPEIPLSVNAFGHAFGNDEQARAAASPRTHVRTGLPPFLIMAAERDLPTFGGMACDFHAALLQTGCDSRLLEIPGRNHNTIMFKAIDDDDPVAQAIVRFVQQH